MCVYVFVCVCVPVCVVLLPLPLPLFPPSIFPLCFVGAYCFFHASLKFYGDLFLSSRVKSAKRSLSMPAGMDRSKEVNRIR